LRSFALRPAFCDFLAAGTGGWAGSVVAASVDAVTAGVTASSGAVCGGLAAGIAALSGAVCGGLAAGVAALGCAVRGELAAGVAALAGAACGEFAGDAETCRLSGALIAGEGGEAIVEGAVALIAGEGGDTIGETMVESAVPRLRGTLAIADLASPSWPAICTTTPLAVAIDPHTSAAEAAASGRD